MKNLKTKLLLIIIMISSFSIIKTMNYVSSRLILKAQNLLFETLENCKNNHEQYEKSFSNLEIISAHLTSSQIKAIFDVNEENFNDIFKKCTHADCNKLKNDYNQILNTCIDHIKKGLGDIPLATADMLPNLLNM